MALTRTQTIDAYMGLGLPAALAQILATGSISGGWSVASNGDFTQDATLGGNIVMTKASTSVVQPVGTSLTAAGTTIADALQLTKVYNLATTVASGTGVKLWEATIGSAIFVQNGGGNNLEVYPPSASYTINAAAFGAAITLAAATDDIGVFIRVAATTWIAFVAPGPAT